MTKHAELCGIVAIMKEVDTCETSGSTVPALGWALQTEQRQRRGAAHGAGVGRLGPGGANEGSALLCCFHPACGKSACTGYRLPIDTLHKGTRGPIRELGRRP